MNHPVESYLEELAAVRASGAATKETSGYPALANLLNAIGPSLKPKVRCLIQLTNSGAGLPDGGFFTPDQFKTLTKNSRCSDRRACGSPESGTESAKQQRM